MRTILGCAAGIYPEENAYSMLFHLVKCSPVNAESNMLTESVLVESLLVAAAQGYNKVLALLFKYGVDVNSLNGLGYSALHLAAYWGHTSTCHMLLDRGAIIDQNSSDWVNPDDWLNRSPMNPLHLAAYNNHMHHAKVVLRNYYYCQQT
ncbi:hypothetical protein F4806DRAFT_475051 [Annulohypoxylon nitens]|nr:hypothetical protein F4806DRAFT_475051 [Annulohypoxylon nitens]